MSQPKITAFLDSTGQTNVTDPDGQSHERAFPDLPAARRAVREAAAKHAAEHGGPVQLEITDPSGVHALLVHADGDTELVDGALPARPRAENAASRFQPAPVQAPAPAAAQVADRAAAAPEPAGEAEPAEAQEQAVEVAPWPEAESVHGAAETVPAEAAVLVQAPEELPSRKSLRDSQSFLAVQNNIEPARKGWQGRLNAFGFSLAPGAVELAEREDEHLVARIYSGPRTIAVVNQKGGASKTPTTICLAAVFGRAGGSVLAWDNNETTGSLPWRVERGDHASSALNVLERSSHLLSDTARAADVNAFVHRQTADKYDALFSDQDIDGEHEISAAEVDVLHAVASKYFNVILMDSGNNHRAANWRRMIGHTDQLVVSTTTVEDRVEGARLTLQGLAGRNERTARLASEAVVIVSQEQPGHEKLAELHAEKFRPYVRAVHVIPFDPALKDGVIHFGALRPATQRAWLAATASIARGL
ncbi:MinD/ParA family ATP-binding protein [Sinomonas humi]|uniref:MinD/ParA family ATP-binding protein n=1 Tax=Sinomonas humi TaxID=1338436 RepID=UPI00068C38DF|nr:ParA family protein [Sinomonas humi]